MTADTEFFIDDKPFPVRGDQERVSTLLGMAGTSPDEAVLISNDGVEHRGEELVRVHPGDRFETKIVDAPQQPVTERIRYTVNGEPNTTDVSPLSLEAILREAGAGAAIDVNDIGSYYLENISTGRKYEDLNDLVPIENGDKFVAIHVGRTPVA